MAINRDSLLEREAETETERERQRQREKWRILRQKEERQCEREAEGKEAKRNKIVKEAEGRERGEKRGRDGDKFSNWSSAVTMVSTTCLTGISIPNCPSSFTITNCILSLFRTTKQTFTGNGNEPMEPFCHPLNHHTAGAQRKKQKIHLLQN